MPSYCTYGQFRRSWKRLRDVSFDDVDELLEQVMADIDEALSPSIFTPFEPWLRVTAVSGNDLTLQLDDAAYVTSGDTLVWYDNTTDSWAIGGTVTVTGVSGGTVTVDNAAGIAADDQVAVVTEYTYEGKTLLMFGPPKEVQARAIAMARFAATAVITNLSEPTSQIEKRYTAALKWVEERGKGYGNIRGASYRARGYASRMDYHHAIDVDDPRNWEFDPDLVDEVESDRD